VSGAEQGKLKGTWSETGEAVASGRVTPTFSTTEEKTGLATDVRPRHGHISRGGTAYFAVSPEAVCGLGDPGIVPYLEKKERADYLLIASRVPDRASR
jgi:hypothetical protein